MKHIGVLAGTKGAAVSGVEVVDQNDISGLYLDHNNWLRAWLAKRLNCSETAADVSHDTFLRLLRSRRVSSYAGEPRALLTHIAKGLVIDHWRKQDVEQAYLKAVAHLPKAGLPSEEARLLILETLHQIDAMLRALPELTRTIFLLSQLDGLKYQDIAERQQVSLPTVKRHMRKAFLVCLLFDE